MGCHRNRRTPAEGEGRELNKENNRSGGQKYLDFHVIHFSNSSHLFGRLKILQREKEAESLSRLDELIGADHFSEGRNEKLAETGLKHAGETEKPEQGFKSFQRDAGETPIGKEACTFCATVGDRGCRHRMRRPRAEFFDRPTLSILSGHSS